MTYLRSGRQCLGKSGLLTSVTSCRITLPKHSSFIVTLSVGELLIHMLYIHFTVVIFLDFLPRNWTLHVPPCFSLGLFPAPLSLPIFWFFFSLHLHLSQYVQLPSDPPADSLFKMILSWLLILMFLFHDGYDIEPWNESFDRFDRCLIF